MEYRREIGKTKRDCSRNCSTRQIRIPGKPRGGNYSSTNGKEFPIAEKPLD